MTDRDATAPPDLLESGLGAAEAARRLAEEGPNALPGGERRTLAAIALETLREPMFLLLLAAGTIYLVFGDLQEGLTLFGFVVITLALTLYQEGRTERAIDALRDLTSPRAGHPRRAAATHRRPRRGARRPDQAQRGRPRARRCAAGVV